MASITSVISLFILLLATYCYSIPVPQRYGSSTSGYEFTTGETKVDSENKMNMKLVSGEQTTPVSHIHNARKSDDSESDESTTTGDLKYGERVTRPPRESEERDVVETTTTGDLKYGERVTRPSREFEERGMVETTTSGDLKDGEHVTRPSREFEERGMVETTTTGDLKYGERVTRPPRESEERDMVETTTSGDLKDGERVTRPSREFEERGMVETTTSGDLKDGEHVTRSSPISGKFEYKVSPMTPNSESSSTMKNNVDNSLFPTMESSTQFEQRAIRPYGVEPKVETTTPVFPKYEHKSEMKTKLGPYIFTSGSYKESSTFVPTSSGNSFGTMTGLLNEKKPEVRSFMPTTEKYDQFNGESTTPVSTIPDKKQPIVEKEKSNH